MFLIFAQNAIGATGFTFTKVLAGVMAPFTFVMVRLLLSAGLSFSLAFSRKQCKPIGRGHKRLFVAASLLGFFVSFSGGAIVAQTLPSSMTSLFFNAVPFITALLAFILFNERLSKRKWQAIAIGCLGLIPCVMEAVSASANLSIIPLIIALFTVTGYAYAWLMVKHLVRLGYAPAFVSGITQLVGGLAAIPFSLLIERCHMRLDLFFGGIMAALVLSTVINAFMYSLLLRTYSPTLLSFAGTLLPCFATLYGWGFLGEKITLRFLLSGITITIGLYLFYRAESAELKQTVESESKVAA